MATITFYGAARQVTGSCYLIETEDYRLLLECGMRQGEDEEENEAGPGEQVLPFDPGSIDAVILSHAHLDHTGMTPLLVRRGYRGPIYMTATTCELLPIMHKDSAFLLMKDVEWINKRRQRAGKPPFEPLYTLEDVERELELCEGMHYEEKRTILPGIELRYRDAGHILGSAIVELWFDGRKLVFSGDLGNSHSPLLEDPAVIGSADILLMESTYGDRNHRSHEETMREFREALDEAIHDGGNVLIPAFAVGRTQDILFHLGEMFQEGRLKQNQVFLDSPMGTSVSEVYEQNLHLFNEDNPRFRKKMTHTWEQWLPVLRFTRETEESMALNRIESGAIIIAGSGMCTGGRIRHHLKHNLWKRKTHVLIVGYQAFGTLGRKLVDGAKRVRILGQEIAVNARIHTLGGFSAHAGQDQLVTWAKHFQKPRPRLFLVHGEPKSMEALQSRLAHELHWEAVMPEEGESFGI
ncbi:MAG: MBL fold metallo-hydrolase [Sedimenticolaceae bacterium]|nr:MBL fold metallo-hydrolase [Sedimenticolaceae bacterium]